MSIDISGMDELTSTLNNLQKGLSIPVIKEWAKRIENDSRIKCSDNIKIEVSYKEENAFNIEVSAPNMCIPFIIDSIERLLFIMPITTRELFKALIKELKKRK